jgi:hypothetical protein
MNSRKRAQFSQVYNSLAGELAVAGSSLARETLAEQKGTRRGETGNRMLKKRARGAGKIDFAGRRAETSQHDECYA